MGHVVITGGASGIGESVALRLARSGHRVTILDRLLPEAATWWASLPAENRGLWFSLDVRDSSSVHRAVRDSWGVEPLDGLVTSAGVVTRGALLTETPEEFSEGLEMNITGTLNPIRSVIELWVSEGRPGSVVTMTSTAGLGYVAGLSAGYHAAKSAIVGITRSVAGDYARHGIRINAVAPGVVRTAMSLSQVAHQGEGSLAARAPAGRLAEPDEVSAVAEWLLSPSSRLTTGHVISVDGGQSAVVGAPPAGYPLPAHDTRGTHAFGFSQSEKAVVS
jgi:NAD(P)-dependent dehydrogenase (short-subunit alcohol dehydrogenase family)